MKKLILLFLLFSYLPCFSQILIEGNKNFSKKEILQFIHKKKTLDEKDKTQKIPYYIYLFYREKSYLDIQIKVRKNKKGKKVYLLKEGSFYSFKEFKIRSENKEENKKVEKALRNYVGDRSTKKNISKVIKKIKSFLNKKDLRVALISRYEIKIHKNNQISFIFYLEDMLRYVLKIKGVRFFKHSFIESLIFEKIKTIRNYKTSKKLDYEGELAKSIQNAYLEKAFLFNKVKIRYQKSSAFKRVLEINIQEGPRPKIKEIKILGSFSKDPHEYIRFIKKNSGALVKEGYFSHEELKKAYLNLLTDLQNKSFLKAKIESEKISFSKDKRFVYVSLKLQEGSPVRIKNIHIKGNKSFSKKKILSVFKVKKGGILSYPNLSESLNNVLEFYSSNGFLNVELKKEDILKYSKDHLFAHLYIQIKEGQKITLKRIKIKGLEITKEKTIRDLIQLKKGDVINLEKINRLKQKLKQLDIFSWVDVKISKKDKSSSKTLILSFKERLPGLFKSGFGVTQQDSSQKNLKLHGYAGLSYNNIRGTAKKVSFRLELLSDIFNLKQVYHEIVSNYISPVLFGTKNKGHITMIQKNHEISYDYERQIAFIHFTRKINFALERLFNNWRFIFHLYSFETLKDYSSNQEVFSQNSIGSIGYRIQFDGRNNIFKPTKGSHFSWNLEYADPILGALNHIQFLKTDLSYTYYSRFRNITFVNNAQAGFIKNLNGRSDSGVPFSKSFFLHGSGKIRGYGGSAQQEHIPKKSEFNEKEVIHNWSHFYILKSEMRLPLSFISQKYSLSFFYDGGLLKIHDLDKKERFKSPYKSSIGLGFHYQTAIGPIVLELAKKINPDIEQSPYRIHISFNSF